MKIYANRYGMIESCELALALQNAAERRRLDALRAVGRAERRERWRERSQRGARAASAFAASLRAAVLRHAI